LNDETSQRINQNKLTIKRHKINEKTNQKRTEQALYYITSLFNMQAPTCFGSRVPSSGSFPDPCELLEKQNNNVAFSANWVNYYQVFTLVVQ
jgi:ABC-type transport system involved in Fe-S cluster assembly fused permease/ATPase subunit